MQKILIFGIWMTVLVACERSETTVNDRYRYKKEIQEWHAKRLADLKGRDGWLNLVGLFWLESGKSSFGSHPTNNIVFPEGKIAPQAGFFSLQQQQVTMNILPGVTATLHGKPVTEALLYPGDSADSTQNSPPEVTSGSLRWHIIRRGDKLGIRLRDDSSKALKQFHDIDRFPVDPAFRIRAKFRKAESNHTLSITNVLGQTTAAPSPGTLVFGWEGETYTLDVLEDKGEYFIIFADETTGSETYEGGRFLYVAHEDSTGKTFIDFNKSYNPPCVFTPYATCPLPPVSNQLPIRIAAGERKFHLP